MKEIDHEEIFKSLNITKILVAILETSSPISVPALKFLDSANEDKDLQVDYDDADQSFVFKLKDKNNG
jgi:hypothetical protein